MVNGKVKWFNVIKGFGFIEVEGCLSDVFVYILVVECLGLIGLKDG